MKRSKFTDSQIMDALKRVDAGLGVPEVCRELGISTATFYKWRVKYGGMDTSMMARMKELEAENARLKKLARLSEHLPRPILSARLIGSTPTGQRRFAILSAAVAVMNRLTYLSGISHLRRLSTPMEN